jgi:hypothetical protein
VVKRKEEGERREEGRKREASVAAVPSGQIAYKAVKLVIWARAPKRLGGCSLFPSRGRGLWPFSATRSLSLPARNHPLVPSAPALSFSRAARLTKPPRKSCSPIRPRDPRTSSHQSLDAHWICGRGGREDPELSLFIIHRSRRLKENAELRANGTSRWKARTVSPEVRNGQPLIPWARPPTLRHGNLISISWAGSSSP